jgi:hypothetical protein
MTITCSHCNNFFEETVFDRYCPYCGYEYHVERPTYVPHEQPPETNVWVIIGIIALVLFVLIFICHP